jgi:hypothetical protein
MLMPLNDTGMDLLASTLQGVLVFAQLHDGPAGITNMDNIAVAGRQPAFWDVPAASFGLVSQLDFTGGDLNGVVYSITLWDTETDGVCYGEFPLTGDLSFNSLGEIQITAIDFVGTTT